MPSVESTSTRMAHFAFQVMLAYLQICKHDDARFHTLYAGFVLPTRIDIKSCWRIKSCLHICKYANMDTQACKLSTLTSYSLH